MVYRIFIIFQKKNKIKYIRFLSKTVTIYIKEKIRFNYKKNYKHSKLANFRLDIIS